MSAIMKHDQRITEYPTKLKRQAQKSLVLAADWAVRNQIRDAWPAWDANRGRIPYHILIDPAKRAKRPQMWSTCWKTARAAQGLYSAHLLTGSPAYLAAADRAMEYVATLQVFEPGCEDLHGSFREDSPQGLHIASRDGMEAVQGFIAGYQVTKNPRFLRRAIAGTDFLLRMMKNGQWPFHIAWPSDGKFRPREHFCFYAGVLVFAQMYELTKNRAYLTRGAIPFADKLLSDYVRPDGALGMTVPAEESHHVGRKGELAGVFINDDGIGVALLAAYAVTGDKRYREAAVGFADFWTKVTDMPEKLAAYPCVTLLLADVYRLTGDRKYLPRIVEYVQKTISLQYLSPREPLLHGCFIGEDMATHYDKKSRSTDYVDLRITSYALIALAKVVASRAGQWGCSYSCHGWRHSLRAPNRF